MLFGGLHRTSLIDYPGKVSCVLFLAGCNFDCPYCHNPGLVRFRPGDPGGLEAEEVYRFLDGRIGLLDGVVVSGGEPTLHEDLPSLCERIKGMGYSVKLDTNGSRPKVLRRLVDEGLIDYIAMDIKTDPFHYAPLVREGFHPGHILESIQIIMASDIPYEFRTTCVRPFVDRQRVGHIARMIRGATLYVLQRFNNTKILNPAYFKDMSPAYDMNELMRLKSQAEPWVKGCTLR